MKKIYLAIIVIILVVAVGFYSKSKVPGTTNVGAILPLTGQLAYLGEGEKLGLDIAQKELGEKSRVNLIVEDSQGDPKNAVTAARKLLSQNKAKILITSTSGASLSVAPLIKESSFLMIADTIDNRVAKSSKYIFRPKIGEVTSARELASIIQPKNKKFAILSVDLDFAKDIIDSFELRVKELGGEIATKEMYTRGKNDFRTELTKIKGQKVDGIFFIDYSGPGSINMYKQKYELGMQDIEVYGDTLTGYDTFQKMDEVNKYLMDGTISMMWPTAPEVSKDNLILSDFITRYKEKYGKSVENFDTQYSYAYIHLLDSVLGKCNSQSTDCLSDELLKYTKENPFQSIVGPIFFDENGNCESVMKFAKLINGKWTEI